MHAHTSHIHTHIDPIDKPESIQLFEMGRWGEGLFDSEMAWDVLGDLTPLAGVALNMIDSPKEDWEYEDIPIMTSEEARAHLNDGNFDFVFDYLKEKDDHHMLLLFIGISMRVGACISKAQLKYVKQVYKKADPQKFFQFDKQMEYAFREYKCGEPYYLKDFDEDGKLLPDW